MEENGLQVESLSFGREDGGQVVDGQSQTVKRKGRVIIWTMV
jgi:hypothetical protein